jgi:hypothetical protein
MCRGKSLTSIFNPMAKHDAKNKKSTKLDISKRIKKNKSWDPVKIDDEDTDFN